MENFYQKLAPYAVYFEVIRKKIVNIAIVFLIFFVFGFMETGNIIKLIIRAFKLDRVSIVTTSPFQFLDLSTKIGISVGLIAILPILFFIAYNFLKDGLTKKEKRWFFIFLITGLLLFIVGFIYSFGLLYFYLNSISRIGLVFGIDNIWDVSSFLSQIIIASVFFGLVFEFPIFLTLLIRLNIFNVKYLREKRRYAIAFIFIFVGFLPPPDILSTIIQAVPLVLMYEVTILINSVFRPRENLSVETPSDDPIIKLKTD